MRYQDFEKVMSPYRMSRYMAACGGNTKSAMTLYRLNLRLSQEMYTVISCFEVALRNAIDKHLILQLFQWMTIDEAALLYGLDHINRVCSDIDGL